MAGCFICDSGGNLEAYCIMCDARFHSECESMYRGNKGYCKCPNCNRIGTLGIIITVKNECFLCKKPNDNNSVDVTCHECNIKMHTECEKMFRNKEKYCQCPNCNKIGTLGTTRVTREC